MIQPSLSGRKRVEQFITSLYNLAENCEYGDLKDHMIYDCNVVEISDQSQLACLQMDADFDPLETAKMLLRQREAVQDQQTLLKNGGQESQRKHPQAPARHPQSAPGKCSQCGRGPHSRQQCSAHDTESHNCKRKGHYSAQCSHKLVVM